MLVYMLLEKIVMYIECLFVFHTAQGKIKQTEGRYILYCIGIICQCPGPHSLTICKGNLNKFSHYYQNGPKNMLLAIIIYGLLIKL